MMKINGIPAPKELITIFSMERGGIKAMPIYTLNLIQYITLIALSVSAGYILHGIVRAIKKGDFFD